MENKNLDVSWVDYLSGSLNAMGVSEGMLMFLVIGILAICVGLVIFKIVSFLISVILTLVLLSGLFFLIVGGSDVNIGNWIKLKDDTTDMLLVGNADGCKIYQANEDIFESIEISGWKAKLGACDKAKELLIDLVDNKGYQRIGRSLKDSPKCPMVLATSRSQIYLEMKLPMKSDSCDVHDDFKKSVLSLNDEKKNSNKLLMDVKEKVLDFIVK